LRLGTELRASALAAAAATAAGAAEGAGAGVALLAEPPLPSLDGVALPRRFATERCFGRPLLVSSARAPGADRDDCSSTISCC
jgi:hypothetical protein